MNRPQAKQEEEQEIIRSKLKYPNQWLKIIEKRREYESSKSRP